MSLSFGKQTYFKNMTFLNVGILQKKKDRKNIGKKRK